MPAQDQDTTNTLKDELKSSPASKGKLKLHPNGVTKISGGGKTTPVLINPKVAIQDPHPQSHHEQRVQGVKASLSESHAVVAYGRMNPPTMGHEALVKRVLEHAETVGGTPLVFLSHTHDSKRNPLTYEHKLHFAKEAFGEVVRHTDATNLFDLVKSLSERYESISLVAGSDRAGDYLRMFERHNDKDFGFASFEVVSAGQRDPDADGVEGMSASVMREAALEGDYTTFLFGLPKNLTNSSEAIYEQVREGLGLQEKSVLTFSKQKDQRRLNELFDKKLAANLKFATHVEGKSGPTDKEILSIVEGIYDEVEKQISQLTPKQESSLQEKANKSGVPFETLRKVYARALIEHSDPVRAFGRVNSFIAKGRTYYNEDADLQSEAAGDSVALGMVRRSPPVADTPPEDKKKSYQVKVYGSTPTQTASIVT